MRIVTIIREKQLDLELIKIKGHSDIELNEKVDLLAKEGSEIGPELSAFFACNSNHMHYFSHFQNNINFANSLYQYSKLKQKPNRPFYTTLKKDSQITVYSKNLLGLSLSIYQDSDMTDRLNITCKVMESKLSTVYFH